MSIPPSSYSGSMCDRYASRNDTSKIHKLKESYWITKQAMKQKFGHQEDEHIVASDSDLDAKLENFKAIQQTSLDLLKIVEDFQKRLLFLCKEEYEMGKFLRQCGEKDKTQAGKMMVAVGKVQQQASQHRQDLRAPLLRLHQEVSTFRFRAVADTLRTVNQMENARTEYRASLLWIKDVSEKLDPDTYKQLEKFRRVQAQVRKCKQQFDRLAVDAIQKVDLLSASRGNMFSHALTLYHTTLLQFWEKTSRHMNAVRENFKGYQHYEFQYTKQLIQPKLEEEESDIRDVDEHTDGVGAEEGNNIEDNDDRLLSLYDGDDGDQNFSMKDDADWNFMNELSSSANTNQSDSATDEGIYSQNASLLSTFWRSDSAEESATQDISVDENTPFARAWQERFGGVTDADKIEPTTSSSLLTESFLPSALLDSRTSPSESIVGHKPTGLSGLDTANSSADVASKKSSCLSTKEVKKDMSSWFDLFADLDPLSNPDSVGRTEESPSRRL